MRRILSLVALALASLVLGYRVREINAPPPAVVLAPRTLHLLYLDSLRQELLSFAEQYGRPVFRYDTVSPVNGYGRIKLARLRNALFDPRIEYGYSDMGFEMDWRGDPRIIEHRPINEPWPMTAAQYAQLRRLWVTPQWPDPPARSRATRRPPSTVPPPGNVYSIAALALLP